MGPLFTGLPIAIAMAAVCRAPVVDVDAAVRARWPEVAASIHDALDERDDVDRCAHVSLSSEGARVVVRVTLADGRTASRTIARRDDAIATLEALLLVPREIETPPQAAAEPAPNAPSPTPDRVAPEDVALIAPANPRAPDDARAADAATRSRTGIELSIGTSARAGDGLVGVAANVGSLFEGSGWLGGFQGELARYVAPGTGAAGRPTLDPPGNPGGMGLELALVGGRRFRFGVLTLDTIAGPAVALTGSSGAKVTRAVDASARTAPPPEAQSTPAGGFIPRARAGATLHFGGRSILRSYLGLDGSFGAARAPGVDAQSQPAHLPMWSVGIAVGATVGTP
jgi:hypothetical protein